MHRKHAFRGLAPSIEHLSVGIHSGRGANGELVIESITVIAVWNAEGVGTSDSYPKRIRVQEEDVWTESDVSVVCLGNGLP
jgi:hypothetical protein